MKQKAIYRITAMVIAILMILGVVAVVGDAVVSASTVNYARNSTYVVNPASYLSGKEDTGSLLVNGVVGTTEVGGTTVSYTGTQKTFTLVFDLKEIKYDIKTIKFMNVLVSGNRDFGADEVTIAVSKEQNASEKNTYTYVQNLQYSTNCFNYVYELSTEAIGRYVTITMYSPQYIISLSEIEIWGSGNPAVDDDEDEPVVVNYAKGNSYIVPSVSYLSGFSDNGKLLTDGNVAIAETSGSTVAYMGTNMSYTLIFDLGSSKDDIKTVKFRNVKISGNRGFSENKVVIAATESQNSAEPVASAYTYVKETQSGSEYFDFTYTLNSEAVGRYVYITMHTPGYVLSLSEIEIYSAPQSNSSIVVPDPIDPTPKFDIVLSSSGQFRKDGKFELICTIKNIKATYGLVGVDFVVNYNPGAFTPVYPNGEDLTANYIKTAPKDGSAFLWEDIGTYCDTKKGAVYMRFAHKVAENGDGVKNDGALVFKIEFTSNLSSGTYNFEATNCRGTDPGSANNKKLTEVYANGSTCSATAVVITSELIPVDSSVTVENGYIYGLPIGLTHDQLAAKFEGNVVITAVGNSKKVGTGYIVTAEGGGASATVIIAGDTDGNGSLSATDYLLIKDSIVGSTISDPACAKAADVNRNGKIDSNDYLKVKSHFVGQSSIY